MRLEHHSFRKSFLILIFCSAPILGFLALTETIGRASDVDPFSVHLQSGAGSMPASPSSVETFAPVATPSASPSQQVTTSRQNELPPVSRSETSPVKPVPSTNEAAKPPETAHESPKKEESPELVQQANRLIADAIQAERQRDDSAASQVYTRAAEFARTNKLPIQESLCLHRLAIIGAKQGRATESETLFREAIRLNPENTALLCDFAKLFSDRQHYREAETILKNAILIAPDNRRVLYNLGQVIALQPNRQMEGLRYLKLGIGEAAALRELARIYLLEGSETYNENQAEFALQKAQLIEQGQTEQQRDALKTPTVPMDEATKDELIRHVRQELIRMATEELAAERDQEIQAEPSVVAVVAGGTTTESAPETVAIDPVQKTEVDPIPETTPQAETFAATTQPVLRTLPEPSQTESSQTQPPVRVFTGTTEQTTVPVASEQDPFLAAAADPFKVDPAPVRTPAVVAPTEGGSPFDRQVSIASVEKPAENENPIPSLKPAIRETPRETPEETQREETQRSVARLPEPTPSGGGFVKILAGDPLPKPSEERPAGAVRSLPVMEQRISNSPIPAVASPPSTMTRVESVPRLESVTLTTDVPEYTVIDDGKRLGGSLAWTETPSRTPPRNDQEARIDWSANSSARQDKPPGVRKETVGSSGLGQPVQLKTLDPQDLTVRQQPRVSTSHSNQPRHSSASKQILRRNQTAENIGLEPNDVTIDRRPATEVDRPVRSISRSGREHSESRPETKVVETKREDRTELVDPFSAALSLSDRPEPAVPFGREPGEQAVPTGSVPAVSVAPRKRISIPLHHLTEEPEPAANLPESTALRQVPESEAKNHPRSEIQFSESQLPTVLKFEIAGEPEPEVEFPVLPVVESIPATELNPPTILKFELAQKETPPSKDQASQIAATPPKQTPKPSGSSSRPVLFDRERLALSAPSENALRDRESARNLPSVAPEGGRSSNNVRFLDSSAANPAPTQVPVQVPVVPEQPVDPFLAQTPSASDRGTVADASPFDSIPILREGNRQQQNTAVEQQVVVQQAPPPMSAPVAEARIEAVQAPPESPTIDSQAARFARPVIASDRTVRRETVSRSSGRPSPESVALTFPESNSSMEVKTETKTEPLESVASIPRYEPLVSSVEAKTRTPSRNVPEDLALRSDIARELQSSFSDPAPSIERNRTVLRDPESEKVEIIRQRPPRPKWGGDDESWEEPVGFASTRSQRRDSAPSPSPPEPEEENVGFARSGQFSQ